MCTLLKKSFFWFLTLLVSAPLQALVVDDTTKLNDTPPPNGAPWNNVGQGNGASVVYLKRGWMVGARHVFGGATSPQVNFGGTIYSGGTIFVLTNPNNSVSDVVMFSIGSSRPAESSEIGIVNSTPLLLSNFTMIGYGARRSGGLTSISYTGGMADGYFWDGASGVNKSWGMNTRNTFGVMGIMAGNGNSFQAIATTFTANGGSGTAQATVGDSGGAVFTKSGNNWQLAATMNAIGGFTGQPGGTAANGNSTFMADMASYQSQINNRLNATTSPPTLSSISPNVFAAGNDPRTLTFFGSSFVNGAKIQIATSNDFNTFGDTLIAGNFISTSMMTLSVLANSPTTWKFRVVNPDGQPSAALTVIVNPQTFSNWLTSYPSLTGNDALTTADPDYDGLANLLEYAFGSDPTQTASANFPLTEIEIVSGQSYLTLSYQKDTSKTDISYQAEMSTDLTTTWTNIADTLVSSSGTLQQRKVSVLMNEPSHFLRIKIVK